jgi:TrmH family RNA methyltransferase
MERMAYGQGNPAVIAVCRQPTRPLETIDLGTKGMLLVAVGSEKPGNLGAMLRTAAAAGCVAVLAAGPGIDLWNPNVIRNSAGAIFTLPTVVTPDAVARTWLDRNQVTTLATVAPQIPGAASLWEIDRPPGPIAVVVGPEHAGLDDHWLTFADRLVTIPQAPTVIDSLNAATAAAVVLFELRRRSHPPRPPACESSLPSTR